MPANPVSRSPSLRLLPTVWSVYFDKMVVFFFLSSLSLFFGRKEKHVLAHNFYTIFVFDLSNNFEISESGHHLETLKFECSEMATGRILKVKM